MKRMILLALMSVGLLSTAVLANTNDEIRARIAPIGDVCMQGDDCGSAAAPELAASDGPRDGKAVYESVCTACHSVGVAGAPKFGDTAAWAPRIAKGMETLVNHAVNGFNAMPAKGGCSSCPDEEIANGVQYMVDNSQ